jgi:polysaccharide biosynthesis protein PelA
MNRQKRFNIGLLLSTCFAPVLGYGNRLDREIVATKESKFLVYYGTHDVGNLTNFNIAVLESEVDIAMIQRLGRSATSLAYLSIGEVNMSRSWAASMEQQGLLLAPNPKWRDARFIDLRDARWERMIINELIPKALARGFTGIFFDTLDDAAYLESIDSKRFKGMKEAGIALVFAVRAQYPNLPIMVNRGYDILPAIASQIDMVLGESVHTTYDVTSEAYMRVNDADIRWQINKMREGVKHNPNLTMFSLDYWTPNDLPGIARIYTQARDNGLIPYVATFDLTQIVAPR